MDQKIAGAITGLIFHLCYTSNLHVWILSSGPIHTLRYGDGYVIINIISLLQLFFFVNGIYVTNKIYKNNTGLIHICFGNNITYK